MTNKKSKSSVTTSSAPAESVDPAPVFEQAMRRVKLFDRWLAADGRSAWSELNRAAYGDQKGRDPRKLTLDDRTIVAQRMHVYLEEVAPRLKERGISRGELCRRAGFGGPDPSKKDPRRREGVVPAHVAARHRRARAAFAAARRNIYG